MVKFGKIVATAAVKGGAVVVELYRFLKLVLIAAIIVAVAFIGSIAYDGIKNGWSTLTYPWTRITGSTPIPAQLPEKVSDDRLKCRAYAMLADFEGAPKRLDADKIRILRTVANYARIRGVDECEIFRRQMELVAPDSVRRNSHFDRAFWYIEITFSETARDAAFLLARKTANETDPNWQAVVLVRPNRPRTFGNQTPEELAKIEAAMTPVEL